MPASLVRPDGVDHQVMMAMVVLGAHLPLDEMLTVINTEMKGYPCALTSPDSLQWRCPEIAAGQGCCVMNVRVQA